MTQNYSHKKHLIKERKFASAILENPETILAKHPRASEVHDWGRGPGGANSNNTSSAWRGSLIEIL